jgi:drug/metabolite transporter (DMT)-like permease
MDRARGGKLYAYVLLLACGVIWGLTFSLARIATSENAHPLGLAFWQAFGGGIVLIVVCIARGKLPPLDRASMVRYVVIALVGTAVPGTLYYYAASRIPAGILAISLTTVPMLTYAFSLPLGADSYQHKRISGILVGFAAILMLVIPDTSLPDPGMVNWLLLALASSVFYSIENIYVDIRVPDDIDMVALLTGALFVASIFLIPILVAFDAWVPLRYPFTAVEWSIAGMAVISSSAYAIFFLVVKMAGAVFASLSAYVVTVAGVIWAILIFGETHSLWVWSSFALLLLGMALVTPREDGT